MLPFVDCDAMQCNAMRNFGRELCTNKSGASQSFEGGQVARLGLNVQTIFCLLFFLFLSQLNFGRGFSAATRSHWCRVGGQWMMLQRENQFQTQQIQFLPKEFCRVENRLDECHKPFSPANAHTYTSKRGNSCDATVNRNRLQNNRFPQNRKLVLVMRLFSSIQVRCANFNIF